MILHCTLDQLITLDTSFHALNVDVDANSVMLPLIVKDGTAIAHELNGLKDGDLIILRQHETLNTLFFRYNSAQTASFNLTTNTLHVPVYGEPKRPYMMSAIAA